MLDNQMPKAYEPQKHEETIYQAWEESGFFNPDNLPGERKEIFSMVLPPPNVTGILHLGHAVMLAIEDTLVRFARLRGRKTLWIPGTDHAAIATQAKVEKELIKEGIKNPRQELGREEFLKRVDQFAQESHDTIVKQVKKMGASLDWSREAFTLDEKRNRAVNVMFKKMYDDGLIYRGDRVVNWCPHCLSTLSDDEVEYREGTTTLYTFTYDKDFPIAISTTRPETKLGDTGVAVNPNDERYAPFVGKTIPAKFFGVDLELKIVADKEVDAEFGTGALGVTPAHSKIDEDIAIKNDLKFVQVIDEKGKMTAAAGDDVVGKSAKETREAIVSWLKERGLLKKEEEVSQNLSVCYRCDTPIEPLPKRQWFIAVKKPFWRGFRRVTLKKLMQDAIKSGDIEILPDRFNKTYFNWIDNLRDWCISRQIWYGHRVPVWYKGDQKIVGEEPREDGWEQDTDTLDTWFSAGIWTFSTLGWPEETEDFKNYHPTTILETGYDILFFWVARMILMTTYALKEVPFRKVYLHGLVRDEKGRKISKSLGNAIDPVDMIEKYGADATRLALIIGTAPGNDTKLSEEKVASYRNFTNKLWNISRFVLGQVELIELVPTVQPETLADKWILSRFDQVVKEVTDKLEAYQFSAAGEELRDFTWNEFADWYLEIAKIQSDQNTDKILLHILERLLVLWHPFMPFVTEAIWKEFRRDKLLIVHKWPLAESEPDQKSEEEFTNLISIITSIRNLRSVYRIEPAQKVAVTIVGGNTELLAANRILIEYFGRVSDLSINNGQDKPLRSISSVVGDTTVYLSLSGIIDIEKERARLQKELAFVSKYLNDLVGKLANDSFLSKAPKNIIEEMQAKKAEAEAKFDILERQLKELE